MIKLAVTSPSHAKGTRPEWGRRAPASSQFGLGLKVSSPSPNLHFTISGASSDAHAISAAHHGRALWAVKVGRCTIGVTPTLGFPASELLLLHALLHAPTVGNLTRMQIAIPVLYWCILR